MDINVSAGIVVSTESALYSNVTTHTPVCSLILFNCRSGDEMPMGGWRYWYWRIVFSTTRLRCLIVWLVTVAVAVAVAVVVVFMSCAFRYN